MDESAGELRIDVDDGVPMQIVEQETDEATQEAPPETQEEESGKQRITTSTGQKHGAEEDQTLRMDVVSN